MLRKSCGIVNVMNEVVFDRDVNQAIGHDHSLGAAGLLKIAEGVVVIGRSQIDVVGAATDATSIVITTGQFQPIKNDVTPVDQINVVRFGIGIVEPNRFSGIGH